jgi:hypothetical protein
MRSEKGLRAVKTTRAPLGSDSGVPTRELGEEMFAGTIEGVDCDMGPGLEVAFIGFKRSRGDETLEQMQEGLKAEEPDTGHAFRCSLPQCVNGVTFEELLEADMAATEKGGIEARGRVTDEIDVHAAEPG